MTSIARTIRLFDSETLSVWHTVPRVPVQRATHLPDPDPNTPAYRAAANHGRWSVEDGAIVGGQQPPGSGLGAYLVTDNAYADNELGFEVKPDRPADTGVLLRTTELGP
jgi:hypothetical protein